MNVITICGNLTKDVELMQSKNDKTYARFTLAVTKPYKSDETVFINVTAFGGRAETIAKYFKKGDPINISGWLDIENVKKEEGWQTYATVICEQFSFVRGGQSRKENQGDRQEASRSSAPAPEAPAPSRPAPVKEQVGFDDSDISLPFDL